MSTLGKVLAILNAAAAIVFLVVAGLDYGKRQAWMFAVLREHFIQSGLPVDEKEKDAEGRTVAKLVGQRMQEQLFAGLSQPVQTQKDEANNRYRALRASVDGEPDAAAKRKIIESIIVPLAQTWGQRDELQRKIHDPNVSIEALLAAD